MTARMFRFKAAAPEITGFYSSRPDLIADPNTGPHSRTLDVQHPLSAVSIRSTEAGRFGNAGRNVVRGPGISNVDVSAAEEPSLSPRASGCSSGPSDSTSPTTRISRFRTTTLRRRTSAGHYRRAPAAAVPIWTETRLLTGQQSWNRCFCRTLKTTRGRVLGPTPFE